MKRLGSIRRYQRLLLVGVLAFGLAIAGHLYQASHLPTLSLTNTASAIAFQHQVVDPVPPSGTACCLDVIATGDIDADGKPDIMVGSEKSVGAVWYHNPSWKRYTIGAGDFTTDGEIADLDRDGDGDVILSSNSRDRIEWWENTGNPFQATGWVRHEIGAQFAHDLAVGDLNGDRRLDVVMFRKDPPQQLTWFAAPTDDPRKPWERHEIDTPQGEGLALGDLDGDGDLDISAGQRWYENQAGNGLRWHAHPINFVVSLGGQDLGEWGDFTRNVIADLNRDGKPDIVLSHAEGQGRVSWFENPTWTEHVIEPKALDGAHSLEAADFDQDGDLDVFVGEMNTGGNRLLVYENQNNAARWTAKVVATSGTHNAQVSDLDGDRYPDIVGKNYTGPKAVEIFKSTPAGRSAQRLENWTYIPVDTERGVYQRSDKYFGLWALLNKDSKRYLGLAMADLTQDGYTDIASGRYFYRNPGKDMTGKWERVTFPVNVDAMLAVDVDGDAFADVIGEALPDVYWLEATDPQGQAWNATPIGTMPKTSHGNGQGYQLAQLVAGGKPEIVLSGGAGDREIYYFEIPAKPQTGQWQRTRITNEASDEGIGIGDMDGDGDIDIAAGDMYSRGDKTVAWWENPGNGSADWPKHPLGSVAQWVDRVAIADINQDKRPDLIVSEENAGEKPNAHVYWFEQPTQPTSPQWPRHLITTQYTTNSLDIADFDRDGAVDVITGEHRGTKAVTVWKNVDHGAKWEAHVVSIGKESHLGTRVADMDQDGDLDIASIAWDDYPDLHLWRNDAP